MFYMIPKDIYLNEELMKNEFTFPCVIFLEMYKSKSYKIYTTLSCMLEKFNISSITKNTTKIKSLFHSLRSIGYINFNGDISNLNTPLEIEVAKYEDGSFFTTIHDFELEPIISIVSAHNVSYMIMNMFIAIKRRTGYIDISINSYDKCVIGYRKLMDEIGIKSFNTMSKYVKLLENNGVLFVHRENTNDGDDGIKTINTYSFKRLE